MLQASYVEKIMFWDISFALCYITVEGHYADSEYI